MAQGGGGGGGARSNLMQHIERYWIEMRVNIHKTNA